ncbi:hypothetical protein D3C72_2155390 [compost metagenome]
MVFATMSTTALIVRPTEPVVLEKAVAPPLTLASAVAPFVPLLWSQARIVSEAVPL